MEKTANISMEGRQFFVAGDLHFSNVMPLYEKSLQSILACPELVFDFSQLKSSDSSGLALIVEWIKLAKQQNKPIQFLHLSQDIMSIAKAAGLDSMFNGH